MQSINKLQKLNSFIDSYSHQVKDISESPNLARRLRWRGFSKRDRHFSETWYIFWTGLHQPSGMGGIWPSSASLHPCSTPERRGRETWRKRQKKEKERTGKGQRLLWWVMSFPPECLAYGAWICLVCSNLKFCMSYYARSGRWFRYGPCWRYLWVLSSDTGSA